MAAGVDELLSRGGALSEIADDGDPGTRPDAGDAGPQMRQQQIAVVAGEFLHALVGGGLVAERLRLLLLPLGRIAHQNVGGPQASLSSSRQIPCKRMPKPMVFSRPCAFAISLISATFEAIRSGRSPQN
jgi:hypothetical protein